MPFSLPDNPIYRRNRKQRGLYEPDAQYRLGAVGSGRIVPTLQVPRNSAESPQFGQPKGLGLDRTTTAYRGGADGEDPFGGIINTLALSPTAVEGFSWGYDKLFGTPNSEAIAKMGLTGNPEYMPEMFTSAGVPPTNLYSGFEPTTNGLNFGVGTSEGGSFGFDNAANLIEGGDDIFKSGEALSELGTASELGSAADIAGIADIARIGSSVGGASTIASGLFKFGSALGEGDSEQAAIEGGKTAVKAAMLSNPYTAPIAIIWSFAEMFA